MPQRVIVTLNMNMVGGTPLPVWWDRRTHENIHERVPSKRKGNRIQDEDNATTEGMLMQMLSPAKSS